jgi:hypothetical protein
MATVPAVVILITPSPVTEKLEFAVTTEALVKLVVVAICSYREFVVAVKEINHFT